MNKKSFHKIFHILWQLDAIALAFLALFVVAKKSRYSVYWDSDITGFINKSILLCFAAFAVLFLLTAFFGFKTYFPLSNKPNKAMLVSLLIPALLFIVQVIIRYPMLGSYQVSDGIIYFEEVNNLLISPQPLITDFLHACSIAGGHIAHGYILVYALGQLLNVSTGMGFQYSFLLLGALASCFLYGIFRKLIPSCSKLLCAICAFIVTVQPMFLGLSTIAQMEYIIVIAFIYSLFFILYRQYILAIFSLLLLLTCKETGLMMAFCLVGFYIIISVINYIAKKGGIKPAISALKAYQKILAAAFILLILAAFVVLINVPLWNGYKITEAIKFGGEGTMNININSTHLALKLRQLYVLNFSWLWLILTAVALIINYAVPAIRSKKIINGSLLALLISQYVVYTAFLLFYQQAKQPRYNMLSDVILLMMELSIIAKVLSNYLKVCYPVIATMGILTLAEVFITIDPVSCALYTHINTGGPFPILWTITTRKEVAEMEFNPGDFGMYNYQYAFMDKPINKLLAQIDYKDNYPFVSASIILVEDQVSDTNLYWDSSKKQRTYYVLDDPSRFHPINRLACSDILDSWNPYKSFVLFASPTLSPDVSEVLALFEDKYTISSPYEIKNMLAGHIIYYVLTYKE